MSEDRSIEISKLLVEYRQRAGLTRAQVITNTCIPKHLLLGMEEGNFSVFDSKIYERNFIRTYARYLNIPDDLIQEYIGVNPGDEIDTDGQDGLHKDIPGPEQEIITTRKSAMRDAKRKPIGKFLIIGAIVILILALVSLNLDHADYIPEPDTTSDTGTTDTNGSADGNITETDAAVIPQKDQDPILSPPYGVMISATDTVWLEYNTETSSEKWKQLMKPGDTISTSFTEYIHLLIGNVNSIKVTIDGIEVVFQPGKVYDRIITVDADGNIIQTENTKTNRKPDATRNEAQN